jgi:RHS repeat-associated protein
MGFPPYGTLQADRFDAVNLANLNVNFSVPLVAVPGRGLNFNYALSYNSAFWARSQGGSYFNWVQSSSTSQWGWQVWPGAGTILYGIQIETCPDSGEQAAYVSNFRYVESDSTTHPFDVNYYDVATACHFGTVPRTGNATDGSGYLLDATIDGSPFVISPSGTKITNNWPGPVTTDSNGNFITQNNTTGQHTDTLGRVAFRRISTANYTDYQFQDVTGVYQTIRLNHLPFNIKTNFACSGGAEYTGSDWLPVSVVLPNGQTYTFTYEETPGWPGYTTARLKRVTLPTGGYYEYQYPATGNNGISCEDASVTSLTRIINDGSSTTTWQYTRTKTEDTLTRKTWKAVVTPPTPPYDAAANQSVYTFTEISSPLGRETSEKHYQGGEGSGQLLRTVSTVYAVIAGTYPGTLAPATRTTILENNQQSKIETDYDGYGNLLALREYAWGTGAPGGLVRNTTFTYLSGSAYTARNILNRVTQKLIKDGSGTIKYRQDTSYDATALACVTGATQHDDTNYGCSLTTRGNPTSLTQYQDPVALTGSVTQAMTYNSLGNVVSVTDPGGNTSSFSYADNYTDGLNRSTYAYLTSTSKPAPFSSQTMSTKYYYSTGQRASVTGENSRVTSFIHADVLNRLTQTNYPDGGQTMISYDDTNRIVTTTQKQTSTANISMAEVYNGLGQLIQKQLPGNRKQDFAYDPLGRDWKVSNLYVTAGDPTAGTTENRHDALGRTIFLIRQDGTSIQIAFTGNASRTTDETGRQVLAETDALGRQTKTCELTSGNSRSPAESCGITSFGGTGYLTTTAYDVLDNVVQTAQGAQTRTATFDGLGRLIRGRILEANTSTDMTYGYDNNGNLTSITDPRGTVNYGYDTLNRRTWKKQGSTVVASFGYDGTQANNAVGRVIAERDGDVSSGADETDYTYDAIGRVVTANRIVSGTTYPMSYSYDLMGNLLSVSYPSSSGTRRLVQYGYSSAGELNKVTDATNPGANFDYVTGATFSPLGSLATTSFGNGVQTSVSWNSRTWLTSLATNKTGGSSYISFSYLYFNNGRIVQITNALNSSKSETYTYDDLNRLLTAQLGPDTGVVRKYQYDYDRYGNRWAQNVIAGSGYNGQFSFDSGSNRATSTGFSYDGSGNITASGSGTSFTYDAENFMTASGSTTYKYDAEGRRVRKTVGGVATDFFYSGWEIIAEKTGTTWTDYVFFGDQRIVQQNGSAASTAIYLHTDHLGSTRVCTDGNGNSAGTCDHEPFGEVQVNSTCSVPTNFRFAGMQFDSETGLYNTWFREFDPTQGRWMSVDPLPGSADAPQSLDRYADVLNDPVNLLDPQGLSVEFIQGQAVSCSLDGLATPCADLFDLLRNQLGNEFDLLSSIARASNQQTGWRVDVKGDCSQNGDCTMTLSPLYGNESLLRLLGLDLNWWKTFAKEFIKSNRREGESFKNCVFRNANEATFGQHGKLVAGMAAAAAAAASNAKQVTLPSGARISLTANIALWAGRMVHTASGGLVSGLNVIRPIATGIGFAGRAAPVIAAGEAGLLMGSAINCR